MDFGKNEGSAPQSQAYHPIKHVLECNESVNIKEMPRKKTLDPNESVPFEMLTDKSKAKRDFVLIFF